MALVVLRVAVDEQQIAARLDAPRASRATGAPACARRRRRPRGVEVSSRRPVGCAGSSGIETGALKWHRSGAHDAVAGFHDGQPAGAELRARAPAAAAAPSSISSSISRSSAKGGVRAERRLQGRDRRRVERRDRLRPGLTPGPRLAVTRRRRISSSATRKVPCAAVHPVVFDSPADTSRGVRIATPRARGARIAIRRRATGLRIRGLWIECRKDCPWSSPFSTAREASARRPPPSTSPPPSPRPSAGSCSSTSTATPPRRCGSACRATTCGRRPPPACSKSIPS